MHQSLRNRTVWLAFLGLSLGGAALYAQTAPVGSDPAPAVDAAVPMAKEAQISPGEMQARASSITTEAKGIEKRIDEIRAQARKAKDILKLNCINDKMAQIKQYLRIIDESVTSLSVAIASNDEAERYHRFSVVTISGEKVRELRAEAEACIGDEVQYLGPLDLSIDEPEVPDDPTQGDDPFGNDVIEPPGYASPFE